MIKHTQILSKSTYYENGSISDDMIAILTLTCEEVGRIYTSGHKEAQNREKQDTHRARLIINPRVSSSQTAWLMIDQRIYTFALSVSIFDNSKKNRII